MLNDRNWIDKKERFAFGIILIAGLILRIIYLFAYSEYPLFHHINGPDMAEYFETAQKILHGDLSLNVSIHAPLYPYFLALLMKLCGENIALVRFLQSILCMCSGIPLYRTAGDWKADRSSPAPLIFTALFVLFPPLAAYQCDFFSENLLLILLSGVIYFLHKGQDKPVNYLWSGFLLGACVLTHPLSMCLLPGFGLWLLWNGLSRNDERQVGQGKRKIGKQAIYCLMFASAVLLPVIPISVTFSKQAGCPVLVQKNAGFNFYLGNNANANGTCIIPPGKIWDQIHAQGPSSDREWMRKSFDWMTHRPIHAGCLLLKKAVMVFAPQELTTWTGIPRSQENLTMKIFRVSGMIFFAAITFAAWTILLYDLRNKEFHHRPGIFLTLFLFYWTALIFTVVSGRYRLPMLPAIFAFCALAPEHIKSRKWKDMLLPALISLLILSAGTFFAQQSIQPKMEESVFLSNMGCAWHQAGNDIRAEQCFQDIPKSMIQSPRVLTIPGGTAMDKKDFEKASVLFTGCIKMFPEHPDGYSAMGRLCARQKRYKEAFDWYKKALDRSTEQEKYLHLYNIGELFQKNGYPEKANEFYLESRKRNPQFAQAWNNSGLIALDKNNLTEAERCFQTAYDLDRSNGERGVNLAYTLWQNGKTKKALALLDELEQNGNLPEHGQELRQEILKK